ncbi:hypothetical protein PN498_01600 [Oscillatoria sp. CS-180]|uniref:hypothetical protein n=1 Tax=Oscillatoria sp. CS-180 TaxID=3021720 RepID=UPI00232C6A74|nr:hypothetical protein [Oscillatoria sp. CS-180]MDB9524669.1 hypothetical protein [Oscillatoria sp. CS-180]
MNKTSVQSPVHALETAIALAQDSQNHSEAHTTFNDLYESVRAENPQTATMLQLLWREYVTTQRSAAFWQELCQVEKHLSERITESHIQLRQNYLRLTQEQ